MAEHPVCGPLPVALVAYLGVACSSSELPPWARHLVDCNGLPGPTPEMLAAVERGEPPILGTDLGEGEGQVLFKLSNAEGARWHLSPATSEQAVLRFRSDGSLGPRWVFQVNFPCEPEASISVGFARDGLGSGPLTPGDYELKAMGLDVADLEQGLASATGRPGALDGVVSITNAADGLVSGYLNGRGTGPIASYLDGTDMGADCTIVAAAFNEVLER